MLTKSKPAEPTRLYAILNVTKPITSELWQRVEILLANKILGAIQLRYKSITDDIPHELWKDSILLAQKCKKAGVTFIINDHIEWALRIGADGVHLGQSDTPIIEAKKWLPESFIIGITCHNSIKLAQDAVKNGASYVAFGRFFRSKTKPEAPSANINILTEIKKLVDIPTVAIGGINTDNIDVLTKHKANYLAMSDTLMSPSIKQLPQTLAKIQESIYANYNAKQHPKPILA